ncbi:MAG: hypothetical protein GPJ54_07975 [Candidatus Heimdallarchaeota archaeon]|nr:hypothetical protein [Candidatus Heimdallarchaeota archaeon]
MITKKLFFVYGMGVILIFGSTSVIGEIGPETTTTIDTMFKYDYFKSIDAIKEYNFTPPEVTSFIDNNITDLSVPGSEVFNYDDDLTGITLDQFRLVVTVINIFVANDHDGTLQGAGEIFIEGTANGNYSRYPTVGNEYSLNDGEDIDTSINLLDEIVYRHSLLLEVRESDTDTDDSLGLISYEITSFTNKTEVLVTDIGDATVTIDFKAYSLGSKILSAGDLLEEYKPYLSVDDETAETEMPDLVSGRVIAGTDGTHESLVLQYFFYWDAEYSPDGGAYSFNLHENDFEGLLIYLDTTDIFNPYRYVFNGYQYTDLPGFPNENIVIFEENAVIGEVEFTNEINDQLDELLGTDTTQSAEYHNINEMLDWGYDIFMSKDVRRVSPAGFTTTEMTVDTSYHTFDFGPGGTYYGQAYAISDLNNTLLKSWYSEIDGTFANGTHSWSYVGIDIPITAPFTFDVTQVFTAPYLISSYEKIVTDAGAITKAKDSKLKITSQLDIGVTLGFPGEIEVKHPSFISPGSTTTASLTLSNSQKMITTFYYNFTCQIEFAYWFIQLNTTFVNDGQLVVDFDASNIIPVLDAVGLTEYEVEDVDLGVSFLTLDSLVISPKFVGTLLSADISLDLWYIIYQVVDTLKPEARPILNVLDYFIYDFILTASMAITSHVTGFLNSDQVGFDNSNLDFTEDALTLDVELTFPSSLSGVQNGVVEISDLNYEIDFTTDWSITLLFKNIIRNYAIGWIWNIGTYPSLNAEVMESSGGSFAIEIKHPLTTPPASTTTPTPFLTSLAIVCLIVATKVNRRIQ